MRKFMISLAILFLLLTLGCSRGVMGGAAAGAGAVGAAYEYQNKKALDHLEEKWKDGEISDEEYLRRKKEIKDKSLIY